MMTIDEFLVELEKTPRRWVLVESVMTAKTTLLRLPTVTLVRHCPISMLGKASSAACWEDGAATLGLTRKDAKRIVRAADGTRPHHDKALRARLLRACDLEELL